MGSLDTAFGAIDAHLRAVDAASLLVEGEEALLALARSSPLDGIAFCWWSDAPWSRVPDYRLDAGRLDSEVEACGDADGEALPHWSAAADGPGTRFTVRLLGPPRRRCVLSVSAEIGPEGYARDEFGWRGRILALGAILQHRMPVWSHSLRPLLGRREGQCLALAAEGLKAKQIAEALGIGQQTVQFHLARAREKLQCGNTIQAAVQACRLGILPPAPRPARAAGAGDAAPDLNGVRQPSD